MNIMDSQTSIFDKLYDVACCNMQQGGQHFSFSKTAYKSLVGANPHIISFNEFVGLENKDSFFSIYLRMLNRLPDAAALEIYKSCDEMCMDNNDLFCSIIVKGVKSSPECKTLNKKVINIRPIWYTYSKFYTQYGIRIIKIYLTYVLLVIKVRGYGIFHKWVFEPIWKAIPKSWRNFIRSLLGRETKEW